MLLGLYSDVDPLEIWLPALEGVLAGHEIVVGEKALARAGELDVLMTWAPPVELLRQCTGLKAILSLGAGVDHILRHGADVPDVPIGRLVDPVMSERMSHYVIHSVIHHHRHFPSYLQQQGKAEWIEHRQKDAGELTVGILGLGALGTFCAERLQMLGYNVCGWRRSLTGNETITCYEGADGQKTLLTQSDFLVCLLPLTTETRGILGKPLLDQLPRGAVLINPGRGGHLVESDILEALDSGQLSGATLDVFEPEPLPADHPFWSRPDILLTPHIAAQTVPATAARVMAADVELIANGASPLHCVRLDRGY